MTIDISVGTVGAACTVATLVGKIVHSLFTSALEKRDDKIEELNGAWKATRETQRVLFEKLDVHHKEFQDYKLHVAETYLVEAKMEKLVAPILSRLDGIERDLRSAERSRA